MFWAAYFHPVFRRGAAEFLFLAVRDSAGFSFPNAFYFHLDGRSRPGATQAGASGTPGAIPRMPLKARRNPRYPIGGRRGTGGPRMRAPGMAGIAIRLLDADWLMDGGHVSSSVVT